MLVAMVDRIAETLESASASIGRASAWDVALMCSIIIVIGLPLLTLVHELGHAIAVRLRGLPLESIVVGNTDDLTFRTGAVIVRLGRVLQDEVPAGYVRYEPTRASASDVIVIALAGPLANLAVAPVFAAPALAGGIGGAPEACLWLLSAGV
jgi:membrane-associated protease RseP (regulator of RpoE activity)